MSNNDKSMKRMVGMVRAFGAVSIAGIGANCYLILSGFIAMV